MFIKVIIKSVQIKLKIGGKKNDINSTYYFNNSKILRVMKRIV